MSGVPCRWTRTACLAALSALATGAALARPPPIRHVFVVVLENQSYALTFGPDSPARYLNSLRQRGASVPNYYGTSHMSLGNYLAMISGQAPNPETNFDCEVYSEFVSTGTRPDGQEIGKGCVYPAHVPTLADQLVAAKLSWRGYFEDMGNDPARERATCGHPPRGQADNTQDATPRDQYATRHNPFMYFHSIIDTPQCDRNVVNLRELAHDLRFERATPNFVFIVPNLCHDGHDGGGSSRCVNGEPGGLESADAFLRKLVPRLTAAPAFRHDGLLIITFDEAAITGDDQAQGGGPRGNGAAAACCDEQPGPNIPAYNSAPGYHSATGMNGPGLVGPGGGQVGAVLLSPFIRPGTTTGTPYNHYSLLRSVEDLFSLPHLGYAAQDGLQPFGPDIYTRPPTRTAGP
ncbi:MAG: phosphoesterase [Gammaproteobacteria bacterium]|nr:phosphoesterase [Gammaproteobacteria bacterium]MDE2251518.1 phosphoesterase [Gammaproteobacteria bacterium]